MFHAFNFLPCNQTRLHCNHMVIFPAGRVQRRVGHFSGPPAGVSAIHFAPAARPQQLADSRWGRRGAEGAGARRNRPVAPPGPVPLQCVANWAHAPKNPRPAAQFSAARRVAGMCFKMAIYLIFAFLMNICTFWGF